MEWCESSVLIGDNDGQAVQLGFQHVAEFSAGGQQLQVAFFPCPQVVIVEGIRQAEYRGGVLDFGEVLGEITPGTLRGRVWRDEFRVGFFKLYQFVIEAVIFRVGDDRVIQHVVTIDVFVELFAQGGDAAECVGHCVRLLHGTACNNSWVRSFSAAQPD